MQLRVPVMLILALSLPLAGCLVDESGEPVDPQSRDGPGSNLLDGANLGNVTPLAFDGRATQVNFTESGSFSATETLVPLGWTNGEWQREVDLASRVPKGVPTHVNVTVTYEDNAPDFFYEMDAYLVSEKGEIYTSSYAIDTSARTIWFDAIVGIQNGHDLTLVLEGIWPDDGSVEYDASILIEADPSYVPHLVPVEVPVTQATGGVVLTGIDGANVDVEAMVWGPDDSFVGRVRSEEGRLVLNVTPERTEGRYVLFLTSVTPEHEPPIPVVQVRPLTEDEDTNVPPRVRMLQTRIVEGSPHTVEQGQTVTWSFTPKPVPIQAGLVIRDPQEYAAHYSMRNDWSVEMVSPAGEVLAFEDGDFPPVWFGNMQVYWGETGESTLVSGEYDVTFTLHQSTPVETTEILRVYQR